MVLLCVKVKWFFINFFSGFVFEGFVGGLEGVSLYVRL